MNHHHHGHDFDAHYSISERIWSGEPNFALVQEVSGLAPGRVLDVGCGEGADAVWLAGQGWTVTALDPSIIALTRAREAAREAGAAVTFRHSGLVEAALPPASFDLVSAFYFALAKTPDHQAEQALLNCVAPGGLLLVVHHAEFGQHASRMEGFNPADCLEPGDIKAALGTDWTVEVFEEREREISGGGGAHHRKDVVLRARRSR